MSPPTCSFPISAPARSVKRGARAQSNIVTTQVRTCTQTPPLFTASNYLIPKAFSPSTLTIISILKGRLPLSTFSNFSPQVIVNHWKEPITWIKCSHRDNTLVATAGM